VLVTATAEGYLSPVREGAPSGLVFEPELIDEAGERRLLAGFAALDFRPVVIRGQTSRRTAAHFGLRYGYENRKLSPGEPMPELLLPLRERAAALAGVEPEALMQALVQRYPEGATIGWHRDSPPFERIVGISLLGTARLRFRRGRVRDWETWSIDATPRSAYVLTGEARSEWEHSIPAAKELRYSVTFRDLRA
jgi:DNA oxidative demethylase